MSEGWDGSTMASARSLVGDRVVTQTGEIMLKWALVLILAGLSQVLHAQLPIEEARAKLEEKQRMATTRPIAEELDGLRREVVRLRAENQALKAEIKRIQVTTLPVQPKKASAREEFKIGMTEEEADKVLTYPGSAFFKRTAHQDATSKVVEWYYGIKPTSNRPGRDMLVVALTFENGKLIAIDK
jgi:hypothetical protein